MRWLACVVVSLAPACVTVESKSVTCPDGRTCPEGTTCNETLQLCVSGAQEQACSGKPDGDVCDVTTAAEVCFQGVCIPSICGDSVVGPTEVCDDGNRVSGDGCSPTCTSNETCGNGIADLEIGEDCDDGNLLDHDGCTSACRLESAQWQRRPTSPSARMATNLAYDSDRDRLVLIGGQATKLTSEGVLSVESDDSWEWDGRWLESNVSPTPHTFAAMAYDAARKRMVYVAAGVGGQTETWESDGATWSLRSVTGPARMFAGVAYDPIRKRVVIQGGYDPNNTSGVPESNMFAWDGTSWTEIVLPNITTLSSPRQGGSMAFDYKRGKLLLFGGYIGTGTLANDLWTFDGTTWTNPTVNGASGTNIPTARASAGMSWNASCECVVLFGGIVSGNAVNGDTFTWNGSSWTKITVSAGPGPDARSYPAFSSDGHGRSILVGGSNSFSTSTDPTAYFADTWIFDGTRWRKEIARTNARVALDTDRHRLVMFGGGTLGVPVERSSDTYELSEHGWTLVSTQTGPDSSTAFTGVLSGGMAYDEARHETVFFGGQRADDTLETGTWIWNGATWTVRSVATTPPAHAGSLFVYDAARKNIVLFGGSDGSGPSNETWTWDGTNWTKHTTATSPSPRSGMAGAYDRGRQRVILFGGITSTGDSRETWIWDGSAWTDATPLTPTTPAAERPLMAWDPARRAVVLLSGEFFDAYEWSDTGWKLVTTPGHRESPPGAVLATSFDGSGVSVIGGQYFQTFESGATWDLRWDTPAQDDLCRIGREQDGDTLAGCTDPDCWSICAPTCEPGETCDSAALRCGDGTCSAAESCRSCPGDCPTCGNVCGDGMCDTGETCPGDCS